MVCLTSEQLQHILSTVQTSNNMQHPPEDDKTQGSNGRVVHWEGLKHRVKSNLKSSFFFSTLSGNQTSSKSGYSQNEGGGGNMREEDRGGGGEGIKKGDGEGTDSMGTSQQKDNKWGACHSSCSKIKFLLMDTYCRWQSVYRTLEM